MTGYPPILMAMLFLSGCAATSAPGTRSSEAGFLTILEAPPSPFPDEPPPEPQIVDDLARRTSSPDPAARAKAWEEANGSPQFQAELQRLRQTLSAREAENFVEVRLVRDPAVAAEFWFKRDAARTLARYTSNPLFRPREGGANQAEQARLRSLWVERAGQGDVITSIGVDPITGMAELGIAVEEAEFRRIAAERGWQLGPELKLHFPRGRPAAFADASIERQVRIFARETRAKGIQLLAGYSGRITLQDGCFRLQSRNGAEPGPLVLFGRETQLGRDREGYLVVLSEGGQRRYRIGELGSWPGPNTVDEKDPEVQELHRRCGSGPIANVAEPQSERLFSLPYAAWVADYARARSISYRKGWSEVIDCMKREERQGRRGLEARDRCIRQFN